MSWAKLEGRVAVPLKGAVRFFFKKNQTPSFAQEFERRERVATPNS